MLEVTPLGTVSTFCYKDKCLPGFLVKHNEHNILLDCGNGITKHMILPDDLNNLTIIISHKSHINSFVIIQLYKL